jgi:NAD+ synthase (glutamine-hydrolysing)
MRIGMAQINSSLGHFSANRQKIVSFAREALRLKCDLVLFPELTLFGYIPQDLLERQSIVSEQLKEFEKLQKQIPAGIAVIVGVVTLNTAASRPGLGGKPYLNTAALLIKGRKPQFFHKQLLPTYDVFDEARHMEPGSLAKNEFRFKGHKILMTICEDIWGWELPSHPSNYLTNPLMALKKNNYDLVLNMSASPYTNQKANDRRYVIEKTARHFGAPLIYVNMVGAQDEIIFDGASVAVDASGETLAQSAQFSEELNVMDLDLREGSFCAPIASKTAELRQALVLGLRDYVQKTGFQKVHLGLSGGIDSAVVACLAVEALGAENVVGFILPSAFNLDLSKDLALKLAQNLGVRTYTLPIEKPYEVMLQTLQDGLGVFEFGLTNENLQSRLRGTLLMAFSNKERSLLLSTSNKCEYATGYSTLYGDMCGALAPLGDVLKGEIFKLAHDYNESSEIIPTAIITRPPTAELRPNQKDQDSLPPYDELDKAIRSLVEKQNPARTKIEKWLLRKMELTEFKRWQAPPILKVSAHAFGRGRRMPIAAGPGFLK